MSLARARARSPAALTSADSLVNFAKDFCRSPPACSLSSEALVCVTSVLALASSFRVLVMDETAFALESDFLPPLDPQPPTANAPAPPIANTAAKVHPKLRRVERDIDIAP